MTKLAEDCENELNNRNEYFSEKSEKWQDSKKGFRYEEDTNALEEGVSLINEALDYFVINDEPIK